MNAESGLLLQLGALILAAALYLWLRSWRLWQAMKQPQQFSAPPEPLPVLLGPPVALDGAGEALAQPPADLHVTLNQLHRNAPAARYRFPLGWHMVEGRAALAQAALTGDVNHVLVTGQSDGGKDNWAIGALLCLALQHSPQQLQVCIIDGKGLDFAPWARKAHTWRLALDPGEIAPAMAALTAERQRRAQVLRAAGASKWEAYRGGDLPLLIVYVSELSLLEDAAGKSELAAWLNSELAAARAFGIRYIVATQTASNFATRWRSQVGLYVAGFQPSASQDEPNTGLSGKEIRAAGAVPPSELPAPPTGAGVFTVVFGREAVNVRAPLVDDLQRRQLLAQLPDRLVVPAEPVPEGAESGESGGSLKLVPGGSRLVPPDTTAVEPEVSKIRDLAAQGWSRNQIAGELGGNRQRALDRIRLVLTGTVWE
jgi:hypothetical protein